MERQSESGNASVLRNLLTSLPLVEKPSQQESAVTTLWGEEGVGCPIGV